MADFIWTHKNTEGTPTHLDHLYGNTLIRPLKTLLIFGIEGTCTHRSKGEDFVTALGYCCFPGKTTEDTVSTILETFRPSAVSELKKELVGQFILIVKQRMYLYIFSDFLQVRNVFYCAQAKLISSSYSAVEGAMDLRADDFDFFKAFEYLAMKYVAYPSWLGNRTINKNIRRLRPYEYIMIDLRSSHFSLRDLAFEIDNKKEFNLNRLSFKLLCHLKTVIKNHRFKDEKIGITLTGGYDTRLVAAIAISYYTQPSFRIAISRTSFGSMEDARIADKIARSLRVPLDVYRTTGLASIDQFYSLTEGMAPVENSVITPIILGTGSYALGLGGCFGTELFQPLPCSGPDNYVQGRILNAKKHIQANDEMWEQLRSSMIEEFANIRRHYLFSAPDPNDEVRIFLMFSTAFFSSFLLAPYNIRGLQLEPYGQFKILEIALKIPGAYIGKIGSFHTNMAQKMAMSRISWRIGRIMTTHYQPMLPCTARSSPYYLWGYLRRRFVSSRFGTLGARTRISHMKRVVIGGACHLSHGWDALFLRRLTEKYGIDADIQELS